MHREKHAYIAFPFNLLNWIQGERKFNAFNTFSKLGTVKNRLQSP